MDFTDEESEDEGWEAFVPTKAKFKHLICLTSSDLKLETMAFVADMNIRLGNKLKTITIDGANLVFLVEDKTESLKPVSNRVPFFDTLSALKMGIH